MKRFLPLCSLLLVPLTIWLGSRLPGRGYYVTATAIVLESLLFFFLLFERRKPQARELVLLAVLCALAVVSRYAFAWLNHFKPMAAVVMVAGIAFGPQAGFLTGAVSAFVSNFLFGQGPWTPWQMFAFGLGGFLAGLLLKSQRDTPRPLFLAIFGFFAVFLVVGPVLDSCTVFTALSVFTPSAVLAVYASGVPVNLIHGLSTFLTLLLLGKPLLEKLSRIRRKYGLME